MQIDRMWIDDVEVDPETYFTAADDDLDHLFCECLPDLSLCGRDISEDRIVPPEAELSHPCVVCMDLEEVACPRCGY